MTHTAQPTPDATHTDFFSLMEMEARAVAAAFGIKTANELAAALVDRMHHMTRGSSVYVAKRSKARRDEAHAAMRNEFNGINLREVAARHGYSEVQARRIVQRK